MRPASGAELGIFADMIQPPVYMDYNATTPCDQRVVEAMLPYFSGAFGNAASHTHAFGWAAREAVRLAREQIADLISAEPGEIVFTSGATEAINLGLKGAFAHYARKGNHIITCQTEHKAVLDTCHSLEQQGAEVTYLPVDARGHFRLEDLQAAFRPGTILVALMAANNETGLLHPLRAIHALVRQQGCLFFCDATQAVGKIPVHVGQDGMDLMSFSAHKMYGPKGVGALYMRRKKPRARVRPQIEGGGHENGFRSGTLNVPGIVGFGKAAALCQEVLPAEEQQIAALRDSLEAALTPVAQVNGDPTHRLPGVSNLTFARYPDDDLITQVTAKLAVSSGSACTSARPEPSHVLAAMGRSKDEARKSLRISLGRFTTAEEVQFASSFLQKLS